jgi:hypothetical protein
MAETTSDARHEVDGARTAASVELDQLGSSVRETFDIPTRLRKDPVRTAALGGGAAFLLLGGPRRVLKAVERRVFPRRRVKRLLPDEVDASAARLGHDGEDVRNHLERDFAAYLRREHPAEPVSARRSFWKTYDTFVGILGAAAARELLKRFMTAPAEAEEDNRQKGG